MEFQNLRPMLRTWDIAGSIDFYTRHLGFRCTSFDKQWGWAEVRREQVAIMFSAPNEHAGETQPAFTGSLYINVDDIDSMWNEVSGDVEVGYPPEDFDYRMREFGIFDNNGYLIQFGTPIGK